MAAVAAASAKARYKHQIYRLTATAKELQRALDRFRDQRNAIAGADFIRRCERIMAVERESVHSDLHLDEMDV
jgi:hypothetical protein